MSCRSAAVVVRVVVSVRRFPASQTVLLSQSLSVSITAVKCEIHFDVYKL